jgi:hypothetical protein
MEELTDIAFCGGELYGLCGDNFEASDRVSKERTMLKLFKFDIGVNDDGAPMVIGAQQLGEQFDIGMRDSVNMWMPIWERKKQVRGSYIVDLHGKPSIAVVAKWQPDLGSFFKVFFLVGNDDDGYMWEEVMSLGDYALFVSPTCSKAVEAGGHMKGNTVYYSCHHGYSGTSKLTAGDGDEVERIGSVGLYVGNGPLGSMWLLRPAELSINNRTACTIYLDIHAIG